MKTNLTIILIEGRGDYMTRLTWNRAGKPEVLGGTPEEAITYTPEEAVELLESLDHGFASELQADAINMQEYLNSGGTQRKALPVA